MCKNRMSIYIRIFIIMIVFIFVSIITIGIITSQDRELKIEYKLSAIEKHPYDTPENRINIELYPSMRKYYDITVSNCDKCHSFSRALNSNYIEEHWEKIVSKMMLKKSSFISKTKSKKIITFLKFYSSEKIDNPLLLINSDNISVFRKENYPSNLNSVIRDTKKSIKPSLGKELYKYYCALCHGDNGEGTNTGLRLNDVEMMDIFLRDEAKFYKETLKIGRNGTLMKGWAYEYLGIFDENQIKNIIEFIRLDWFKKQTGREKPKRHSISTLNHLSTQTEGKLIFNNSCISCHNDSTNLNLAPDIRNFSFIGMDNNDEPLVIDDEQLRYIIKYGRDSTIMKPFLEGENGMVELDNAQIDSIIKYIRSNVTVYK